MKVKIFELEESLKSPDIWDNPQKTQGIYDSLGNFKSSFEICQNLDKTYEDILLYMEIALQGDASAEKEAAKEYESLIKKLDAYETQALMSGEFDQDNAIISIHAGAGGTDSQDWAEMLMRMYLRYCQRKEFKTEIADISNGEEAGIKSATIMVSGKWAYGFLKSEAGVHRLVRLSPFDSAHRRHTSFSQIEVIPERDERIDIKIASDDIRIETYRASGAGGQHVNKTDSAVRIVHIPTNIIVQCQNERSQHQNKFTAMKILKAKLFEMERKEKEKELALLRGEHKDIAWGSQIRSYVFHPYSMVKDHRTNAETGNVQSVMDGDIDLFTRSWLEYLIMEQIPGNNRQ